MLEKINKILQYLRINDEKGRVSLTNIALILILVKIAVVPATSMKDIAALMTVVLSYQVKRKIDKG